MANYYGTTASEGGKVSSVEAVNAVLKGWKEKYQLGAEGGVTVEVYDDAVSIYGEDDFYIYAKDEDGEIEFDDITEDVLKELCPFIETALVIKSVGNEKCRYVNAGAWIVTKDNVTYANLDDAINAKLNSATK